MILHQCRKVSGPAGRCVKQPLIKTVLDPRERLELFVHDAVDQEL
jgi:hypothetical protein